MTRTFLQAFGIALLGVAFTACAERPTSISDKKVDHDKDYDDPIGDPIDKPGNKPEDTVGTEDNTYDHTPGLGEGEARDPYDIAKQREEEGSPEARARLHSCQKLQIATVRNILADFGVNLDATGNPPTAGQLLSGGGTALGAANYAARTGEDIVWTAAGAAKLFDIWVQAAPEIIAAMPTVAQCQIEGTGPDMFTEDADGNVFCNPDAVSCIIGRPATEDHIAICESLIESATNVDKGKNIAVAALLSAAHSCE